MATNLINKANANSEMYANLFIERGNKAAKRILTIGIGKEKTLVKLMRYFSEAKFTVVDTYNIPDMLVNMGFDFTFIPVSEDFTYDEFKDNVMANISADDKFDLVLMNPPFSIGGKVWDAARKVSDNVICLMPLSQYFKEDRYKYIRSFELVNSGLFESADITKGLAITESSTIPTDITFTEFLIDTFNPVLRPFYEWNTRNNIGLEMTRSDYQKPEAFDLDKDFIDSSRIYSVANGGGYYYKNGFGYAWNVNREIKTVRDTGAFGGVGVIHFESKEARDNFCKWAYNYTTDKYDCLASLSLSGLNVQSVSNKYYMSIPQIDWSSISSNSLWQKGLYDEAVLNEMGLEWVDAADKSKGVKVR